MSSDPVPQGMIERNCSLCDGVARRTLYAACLPDVRDPGAIVHSQYADVRGTARKWNYRIVRCENCGHIYADPVFSPAAVERSYLEQEHDNQFAVDSAVLARTQRGYAHLVRPYLPAARGIQLDIGCDTGLFLKETRNWGFRRSIGVEPGAGAARVAATVPGVEVLNQVFSPDDFEPQSVDCVSLIHVLDHLMQPREFLRDLRLRMRSGGIGLIVVHNIGSILARVSGVRWSPLGVIHFDYFTPETLRRVAVLAGWEPVCVRRTVNYFPLFHLVRYAPGLPPRLREALHRLASSRLLCRFVFRIPLGNIALVMRAR